MLTPAKPITQKQFFLWANKSWVFCGRWRVIPLSWKWSGVRSTSEAPEQRRDATLLSVLNRMRTATEASGGHGGHICSPCLSEWLSTMSPNFLQCFCLLKDSFCRHCLQVLVCGGNVGSRKLKPLPAYTVTGCKHIHTLSDRVLWHFCAQLLSHIQ